MTEEIKEAVGCMVWLLVPIAFMGAFWVIARLEANWP